MTEIPFLIALAGPEGTGNTTLANALGTALGLAVLPDLRADMLQESRCHTLFEAARLVPMWQRLLQGQLKREAELTSPAILDTCALDYWVLWQRWSWCSSSPADSESLYQQLRAAAERYIVLIRMPSVQLPAPASHRFIDPAYAAQSSRLLVCVASELISETPLVSVLPGPADAQLQETAARIRQLGWLR